MDGVGYLIGLAIGFGFGGLVVGSIINGAWVRRAVDNGAIRWEDVPDTDGEERRMIWTTTGREW